MRLLPTKGYLKRMREYLHEMFPVGLRLFMSVVLCMSFFGFLAQIEHFQATVICVVIAACSVFCVMLILRLMDELKDREIDEQLFRDRPLPSGRILEFDIKFSLVCTMAFCTLINLWTGKALWMMLFVLAYAFLMFRHFFIPNVLRENLLLTLATHNPVIPLLLWYLVSMYSADQGVRTTSHLGSKLLVVLMYWMALLSWELSRKIRSAEEENAYVTYSQIFGRIGAALVTIGVQSVAFAIGVYFFFDFRPSATFLLLFAIGYGITIAGHVRFLLNPNPVSSQLKKYSEVFALSLCIAQIAGSYFQ